MIFWNFHISKKSFTEIFFLMYFCICFVYTLRRHCFSSFFYNCGSISFFPASIILKPIIFPLFPADKASAETLLLLNQIVTNQEMFLCFNFRINKQFNTAFYEGWIYDIWTLQMWKLTNLASHACREAHPYVYEKRAMKAFAHKRLCNL